MVLDYILNAPEPTIAPFRRLLLAQPTLAIATI
jgi:hypothetical protein